MIELTSVSPSSITKFVQCPRQWCQHYDRETAVDTSGTAADRGKLVHRALELWREPGSQFPPTLLGLHTAFEQGCLMEKIAEGMEVYQTARALLSQAYKFTVNHPVMPLHRTKMWMCETKIDGWRPSPEHPLSILGYIDTIELVHDEDDPKSVVLVVGDYKTGKGKSKDELLDDIQPPIYMAYALYVLKPWLESQGYDVKNVLNVWTYIAEELCVVLTQDDYDLQMTLEYVANISRQMLQTAKAYNEKAPGYERATFLSKIEKLNPLCNWCPVRRVCTQVNRAFETRAMIDLFGPGSDIGEILKERDLYALAIREGEERKKEIDKMLRVYMAQHGLDEIEANGHVYWEVHNRNKKIDPMALFNLFGTQFFVNHGQISQESVKNALSVLKITQPDKYEEAVKYLEQHTSEEPGARYIRSKNAKSETKSRGKKLAA